MRETGRGIKKPASHARDKELRAVCQGLSKAALIDVVGDAMDAMEGEGSWKVADLIDFIAPRVRARGDREPKSWKALRPVPRPCVPQIAVTFRKKDETLLLGAFESKADAMDAAIRYLRCITTEDELEGRTWSAAVRDWEELTDGYEAFSFAQVDRDDLRGSEQ